MRGPTSWRSVLGLLAVAAVPTACGPGPEPPPTDAAASIGPAGSSLASRLHAAPREVRVDVRLPADEVRGVGARLGSSNEERPVRWWFARSADRVLLASGRSEPELRRRAPAGADLLLLAAPGCDLELVPLSELRGTGAETVPTVRLHAAEASARVRLLDRRQAGDWLHLQVSSELLGSWRAGDATGGTESVSTSMSWELPVALDEVDVPLPGDFWSWASVRSEASVAFPAHRRLEPDREYTFGFPRLRTIALVHDGADVDRVRLVADRTTVPDRSADELAALDVLASLDSRVESVRTPDGTTLRGVPPVPHHVLLTIDGHSALLRLEIDQVELPVPRRAPRRPLPRSLLVDGRPPPPDTVILPGRHDLTSAHDLLFTGQSMRDLVHVVPRGPTEAEVRHDPAVAAGYSDTRAESHRPVDLPAAEWLTLIHPRHGLAWVRHSPDRARTDWHPGRIEIRTPSSAVTGWVVLRTAWPGAGDQWPAPARGLLPTPLHPSGTTRIRGLPPGRYRLWVDWQSSDASPADRRRHMASVDLSDDSAAARVRVPEPP